MKKDELVVSVVVPVLDEEKLIGNFLESILDQKLKPSELVVVDGGSTDKTQGIVGDFKAKFRKVGVELRWIETEKGVIKQRDRGFREAKGKVIASMDADTVYPKNYLAIAVSRLGGGFVAVTGDSPMENAPWYAKWERRIDTAFLKMWFKFFKTCGNFFAYNVVFLKKAYLDSGGMKLEAAGMDQSGLAKLLNTQGRVYFEPKLRPVTSGRRHRQGGLGDYLRMLFYDYWWAYFKAKVFKKETLWERVD